MYFPQKNIAALQCTVERVWITQTILKCYSLFFFVFNSYFTSYRYFSYYENKTTYFPEMHVNYCFRVEWIQFSYNF